MLLSTCLLLCLDLFCEFHVMISNCVILRALGGPSPIIFDVNKANSRRLSGGSRSTRRRKLIQTTHRSYGLATVRNTKCYWRTEWTVCAQMDTSASTGPVEKLAALPFELELYPDQSMGFSFGVRKKVDR